MHLIVLLSLLISFQINASVTASVDQKRINYGQSIQLNLKSDNAAGKTPNLTLLKRSFKIIGSSKVSRPYIVKGQRRTKTLWFYILQPKHAGTLTIPPMTVNREKSSAISIKVIQKRRTKSNAVTKKSVNIPSNTHNIIVQASLNKKVLYPNEMLVYQLTINAPKGSTNNIKVTPPFIAGAIILPLATPTFEQSKIRGKAREIRHQSFAIFAQEIAIYQIDPAQLVFSDVENSIAVKPITLKANNLHFEIKAKGNQTNLGYWLPSPKIHLTQYIEPYKDLNQGDTIRRTITLEAQGLDADSLPLMSAMTHESINMSLEDVSVENIIKDGVLIGKRSETVAMTFNTQGSVNIDPVDIHWWNTRLDQARVATLSAQTFNVIKAPAIITNASNKTLNNNQKSSVATPPPVNTPTTKTSDSTEKLLSENQLNAIIALLFILLVATTTGWLVSSRKKR